MLSLLFVAPFGFSRAEVGTSWRVCSSDCIRSPVLVLQEADEALALPQWVQGTLANGDPFWWWYDDDDTRLEDAEVALEQPSDAWRIGTLSDGSPYTWRASDDPDDPEIKIWKEGELSTGCVVLLSILRLEKKVIEPLCNACFQGILLVRRRWDGELDMPVRLVDCPKMDTK